MTRFRALRASSLRRRCTRQLAQQAWKSTLPDAKEKETGHFDVEPKQSLLFFDNILPVKLNAVLRLPYKTDTHLFEHLDKALLGIFDPVRLVKRAIPDGIPLKVMEIMPRIKDGGAFVKIQHDASISPSEIEETLLHKLEQHPLKPWFNPFRDIKARLVRGTPWLEDLYRFPSPLLRVDFVPTEPERTPAELSEETLYSLFRRYGKITDIIPQPWDSKETPRHAKIGFSSVRSAIMAHNCVHGFVVTESLGGGKDGTVLRLSYLKRVKPHSIWNWFANHPRIVIPILAALLAGFSVIIFDPIRKAFVKIHVQQSLRFTESGMYKWLVSQTGNFSFSSSREQRYDMSNLWQHRRDVIEKLQGWLDGASDTFIVVTGPRGSGKVETVMDQSLAGRQNVLLVDCKPIVEASGEAGIIKKLASAVGYRPVFSWANSISSMIDLALQSTTGVKAGFSETLESQMNQILQTTATALKEVALAGRSKKDKDANLSEDAFLEAHTERRPVIVIDNFLHKNDEKMIVYDKIAEWASSLVQNNVAHVVILTSDNAYSKPLSKAMPNRVFRTISLGDMEPSVAKEFVLSRLGDSLQGEKQDLVLDTIDQCVSMLGGRLTDLEFLARRLKAGQDPRVAMYEIVRESATDIFKMFLQPGINNQDKKWSMPQVWTLVKHLSNTTSLSYNDIVLAPSFTKSMKPSAANGEAALKALADAELITLTTVMGRPDKIHPGKPVFRKAFDMLMDDDALCRMMDLAALEEQAAYESKRLHRIERELVQLAKLPTSAHEIRARITFLLQQMGSSQWKIDALENVIAPRKRVKLGTD
ncbi:hypothetical protein CDD81_6506 [Ophiocordyceps australis]|uniref:Mitochondrial escape protein 2 n=1 Tax=Ophiocordyceps australis TaxID=1399860 RepID=A0A2C5XBZ1_9HYPO|nr:hypothetical protein CDD81_6506 [Ophiocordyceps australis]